MSKRLSHSALSRRRPGPSACGREDGAILRRTALFIAGIFVLFAITLQAGDILRGGATSGSHGKREASEARGNAGAEAAAAAQVRAKDRLARTTKALTDMRNLQAQARAAAGAATVPNGLTPGGLQRWEPGEANFRWDGARAPVQRGNNVNIKQLDPQAVLHWKSFNVGRDTTVEFDQSSGGADAGKWIAFNKVVGATAPSQIRGRIRADGQVYIINQNGIVFGAGSQVNTRALVASSLPINDNLIQQGLLNNRDAQFLFSGLSVPGGSDGTPEFVPPPPPQGGRYGNVTVERGASIRTTTSADGNGGRVMLVGANVQNAGVIETPAGQTILAAGIQAGFAAHSANDPSLRGLDAWIGQVADYAGTVTNTGLVESRTGSILLAGRSIRQMGILESTTSVDLSGRIDLLASFGAVSNPGFDNPGTGGVGGPIFVNQFTGLVEFGPGSLTRILPEYDSPKTIVGTTLPVRSRINVGGQIVDFKPDATLFAPNANVTVSAGLWPYKDADGNRSTLNAAGEVEPGLINFFSGSTQKFLRSGGLINMEAGAVIDVAGTAGAFVPLAENIVSVEFRGAELADSPLQRATGVRGTPLVIDLRKQGSFSGRYWVGTPLGDATGQANLLQRNVGQLTVDGGSVDLQAGGAITLKPGSLVDVSGGFFSYEAGPVRTTRLMYQGRFVDVANATPDRVYDGIFTGTTTPRLNAKWGLGPTFALPLAPDGVRWEDASVGGGLGGSLSLQAASVSTQGTLRGETIVGPRQLDTPPSGSRLAFIFDSQYRRDVTSLDIRFLNDSPIAPDVQFAATGPAPTLTPFSGGDFEALPFETLGRADYLNWMLSEPAFGLLTLSPKLLTDDGFANLSVTTLDGAVTVNSELTTIPGGSLTIEAAQLSILASITSQGGTLSFSSFAISPFLAQTFELENPSGALSPTPTPDRGWVILAAGRRLNASGMVIDDRDGSTFLQSNPRIPNGGSIEIESFSAELSPTSVLDVSGGVTISARGGLRYGRGGSISILTGRDQTFPATTGGVLNLGSSLRGYSGRQGGSLTLQTMTIHVGHSSSSTASLSVRPSFFSNGGFQSFTLRGVGGDFVSAAPNGNLADSYIPTVVIEPGVVIQPVPVSLVARPLNELQPSVILETQILPEAERGPVNLTFQALGYDDTFTQTVLESRGDFVMGRGARILAAPKSSVTFLGQTVTVYGEVTAPGGTIRVQGASSFPLNGSQRPSATFARPTVYLANRATLSTAGTSLVEVDAFGRRVGDIYDGGTISISGNILAEAGATLDVSGTSAVFDFHPMLLSSMSSANVPLNAGLNSEPWGIRSVPVTLESSGGVIDLTGSEMLFSDAKLIGRSGGPTANGGTLRIFSGRFYPEGAPIRTSADINLVVKAKGNVIPEETTHRGIGRPVVGANGNPIPGMGFFAVEKFNTGGFDSLDLGAKFFEGGNPFPFGGNVRFEGDIRISARGMLRVAQGGVIEAAGTVALEAPYVALGQPFRAPTHPDDNIIYFYQSPATPSPVYNFLPTPGTGNLRVSASVIDVGTLALQQISTASFSAPGGDIRGNGTLQMAGSLTLEAAQIYPTTLSAFDIFVYDTPARSGSVSIIGSGRLQAPLSAGGSMGIFASNILQGGLLRAPFGRIVLGWDGVTDLDPSDDAVDGPSNRIAGNLGSTPLASNVTLAAGSVTTVSGIDWTNGRELLIPYGLSPDGLAWIDPSGVNITTSGLPQKQVQVLGNAVNMAPRSTVDIQGGGDLYAFRWIPGQGGSIDLLGSTPNAWSSGVSYTAGDRVSLGGQVYSARVGNSGQMPEVGPYWSLVPQSFAVLPNAGQRFAPFANYNASVNASELNGDPGWVDRSLRLGQQIRLSGIPGLPAGDYTLLPSRYALLPGSFLITETESAVPGTYELPIGSYVTQGRSVNPLLSAGRSSPLYSSYEVLPFEAVRTVAEYADYFFNDFALAAAERLQLETVQRLPRDAGGAVFQGTAGLKLAGRLMANPALRGRGGFADIASSQAIYLVGGRGSAPSGASAVLGTGVLSSWNVESLLIGATRRSGRDEINVRTSEIIVDSPGSPLRATDLVLASRGRLTVTGGSVIESGGQLTSPAPVFTISGDGAALRVSQDGGASLVRSAVSGSDSARLTVGPNARISGRGVILDSTYGTELNPSAVIQARKLTLGSGQVSILFPGYSGGLDGLIVDPHLILSGGILENVQSVGSLKLRSYRTIDLYGSGQFGSDRLKNLTLEAGGIRGYGQSGTTTISAATVTFSNPTGAGLSAAPNAAPAVLAVVADRIRIGDNAFRVAGFESSLLRATGGLLGTGRGTFQTDGALTVAAPIITGDRGTSTILRAEGALVMNRLDDPALVTPGSGAAFQFLGDSVVANTNILLPSGQLTFRAFTGDISLAGIANVGGTSQTFYDVVRYADAGTITFDARNGNVQLLDGSLVDVSAVAGGGDAGTLEIVAPNGAFSEDGTVRGSAGPSGLAGNFVIDAGGIDSFSDLQTLLSGGGFTNSQSFRLRSGDIVLDGVSRARAFSFAADQGGITVVGTIDASGRTGGAIALSARDSVIVSEGAVLTVAAQEFSSAGKGGTIRLEAGSQFDGVINTNARVSIGTGSVLDLSVDEMADFVAGDYRVPGSAAFYGRFEGTLHLRAPRIAGNDVGVESILGTVNGASSILVEGYRLYDLSGSGTMNRALRDAIHADNIAYMNAGEASMRARILSGSPNASALDSLLVVAPGVEIVNRTGDLTLGLANPNGSTNIEARSTADWDLSTWRYGSRGAPGVLTLRAQGDLVFNNALSDGFTPVSASTANGNSAMWLGTPQTVNNALPTNTQSWSYRLAAGADFRGADVSSTLGTDILETLQPGKGSVLVGEFYPQIPNPSESGISPGVGLAGLTSGTIRISTTTTDLGTRFEVIRTGTGSIDVAAGRDVQLRNQFASIYTAGVAIPTPTTVFNANDFVIPVIPTSAIRHPSQGNLGAIQQLTQPAWTLAGGSIAVRAERNIGRYTFFNGQVVVDSSRQLPNNWLYRRGYVDPATGRFANNGGVDGTAVQTLTDPATSTTWWIDFSNFFQGIGALGGGDIALLAANDIVNVDAVIPTNARMSGRDPLTGENLAPDASKLVEWGGGDLSIKTGRDISGGAYFVQSGAGTLNAGRSITTNSARSPSLGYLGSTSQPSDVVESQFPATFDSDTWLPTTLFVGDAWVDVKARGDIIVGPAVDTFLLPQGLNNRFWYKTQFANSSAFAGVNVASFGGSVTHRYSATLPGSASPTPVLSAWMSSQNVFVGAASLGSASYYQPWIRLVEQDVGFFETAASLNAPTLISTAFAGSIQVVGSGAFRPSASGDLQMVASGGIFGLNRTGRSTINGQSANVWTYSTLNVSDADPDNLPSITNPTAYQAFVGRNLGAAQLSSVNSLATFNALFAETGSTTGAAATFEFQQALHAAGVLHAGTDSPVRLYATGGDLTGLTLFAPKFSRIHAERDLTDVAFYIQNTDAASVSVVSAGRDVIPFNEDASLRVLAGDLSRQNTIRSDFQSTVIGTSTTAMAGDIQIGGPGVLEVLAGRTLDLGTGANFVDGTGVGITSIANARNPFLPRDGASLIVLAGVGGPGGIGPALGLSQSSMAFAEFIQSYRPELEAFASEYVASLTNAVSFTTLTAEQQAIVALEFLYELLRRAGTEAADGGTYDTGFSALTTLFEQAAGSGDVFTRSRDIRTISGGSVTLAAPAGALTLASDITGNPQTPPGIVTEFGGRIDILTEGDVDIGQARIFTLRGGDLTIWSSAGDIAAGNAPKTVVTAPPTRVVIDSNSAAIQTDLGGLATGGGIGVLASVEGVEPGNVALIAPLGTVDAGDAGIRATGDITIAAVAVVNADNISAGGSSVGVPSTAAPSAPAVGGVSTGSSSTAAANAAAEQLTQQNQPQPASESETPSLITVEVIGYGGGDSRPADEEDDEERESA